MKHPLYVGYFDTNVLSVTPSIIMPINIDAVLEVLIRHCDRNANGSPILVDDLQSFQHNQTNWLGQIDREDVLYKAGYLICPWLGVGTNRKSVAFICELKELLNIQVFEPGDCVYLSSNQLIDPE